MKKLSVLLISTIFASTAALVACADDSVHGHSHDSAEQHGHKKDDHDDHAHAENDKHARGDDDHHEHKKERHDEHDADHKHDDQGYEHGDDHGHAHHGGIVAMVDGVHHELVITNGKVSLYAEGLPVGDALKAVKVRMTLLRGTEKQEVEMRLAEGDEHRFDADLQLQPKDKVVVLIQTSEGKTRLARFDIPAK